MANRISAEVCDGRLEGSQISQWREQGYVFVSGLLPSDSIARLEADAVMFGMDMQPFRDNFDTGG